MSQIDDLTRKIAALERRIAELERTEYVADDIAGNFSIGGTLGIGTATPDSSLEVFNGDMKIGDDANTARFLRLERNGSGIGYISTSNSRLTISASNNVNVIIQDDSGNGILVEDGGQVGIGTDPTALLDINSDILRLRTAKTPASAGASGNAGDFCWDATYFYICVATDTWERVQHDSW